MTAGAENDGGEKKAALFTGGGVFNKKTPTNKDDTEKKSTKNHEYIACLQFKVVHGSTGVQETLVGLLDHCLRILHEQDKTACILNKKKTLEA